MKPTSLHKIERVVFYIRVSTEEQKLHGLSLDAQRMKLEEYANKNNLKVVGSYVDEGVSGRKEIKKRPQLQRMLDDAQKNMFDLIIFIKLDRYFRSVAEYHECQKILESHNVKWATTEEKYDLTTANGRAFVNMKLTIAELEADQTGERIKLVNEYKVKEGYALSGSVPFGWRLKREGGHSRVVRDENVEHIVNEFLDRFEQTKNLTGTIDFISEKYELTHTYKVLANTLSTTFLYGFYRGNYNYCEPYITKERYDRLQSIRQSNIRDIKAKRVYLFSNLVTCGCCGSRCTGNYTTPRGKEFLNYRCNHRTNRIDCKDKNIMSEKKIENYLLNHIDDIVSEYIYDVELNKKSKNPKTIDKKKILDEMERLNFMFQKNRITVEKYDAEYSELERKLKEAETVNHEVTHNFSAFQPLMNGEFLEGYRMLDREHKRSFWQSIIKEIIINGEKIKVTINGDYL